MQGVDVLAVVDAVVDHTYNWNWVWYIAVLCVVILLILSLVSKYDLKDTVFIAIVGILLGAYIGAVISVNTKEDVLETQYKVTISDEVNLLEFNDRYEIVDQEGQIFTIKERTIE